MKRIQTYQLRDYNDDTSRVLDNDYFAVINLTLNPIKTSWNFELSTTKTRKAVKKFVKWSTEVSKSGKTKSTAFLYELKVNNRLSGFTDLETPMSDMEFGEQIDMFITLLKEKFEDDWDIQLIPCSIIKGKCLFALRVVLHYPEIVISNESDETHTINDIFIHLNLRHSVIAPDQIAIYSITANKTTFAYKEIIHGYIHSHISRAAKPTDTLGHFGCFRNVLVDNNKLCLGEDTVLSDILEAGTIETNYTFSSEMILSLLYGLDSALEWESAEGGPFIYFYQLYLVMSKRSIPVIYFNDMEEFFEMIDLEEDVFNSHEVFYQEGKYVLKQTENFDNHLLRICQRDLSEDRLEKILCIFDEQNNAQYHINSVVKTTYAEVKEHFSSEYIKENYYNNFLSERASLVTEEEFKAVENFGPYFKGEIVPIKILPPEDGEEMNEEINIKVRKNFKDYVTKNIQTTINENIIARDRIQRHFRPDNS